MRGVRIPYRMIIGLKWLIVGDVGTGKTRLTADMLRRLIRHGHGPDITVIDMAPDLPGGVGAPITKYVRIRGRVRYLRPERVYAPRLMSASREEVVRLAEENRRLIDPLLDEYLRNPTPILVVNDSTIYLHAGDPGRLERCIKASRTAVVNAYYGKRLEDDQGSGISLREREAVRLLMRLFSVTINLNEPPFTSS